MKSIDEDLKTGIWDKVEKTDLKSIVNSTVEGRKITSVKPMFQNQKATEVFGPFGLGWGIEIDSEQFTYEKQTNSSEVLSYQAVFFYRYNGEIGRFPIASQVLQSYVTKQGKGYFKVDTEAMKKVKTNAISKGLSMLGFNADIFKAFFEDQEYVNDLEIEERIENGETAEKIRADRMEKLEAWKIKTLNTLGILPNLHALELAHNNNLNSIYNEYNLLKDNPDKMIALFTAAYNKRKQQIIEGQKQKQAHKQAQLLKQKGEK